MPVTSQDRITLGGPNPCVWQSCAPQQACEAAAPAYAKRGSVDAVESTTGSYCSWPGPLSLQLVRS